MTAEQKAIKLIASRTTEQLIQTWELTSIANDENIPTVRGWIMNELEKRDPEGYNAWLESDADDMELSKYIKH